MLLGRLIPYSLKLSLRERVFRHYQIPWNRHGLPTILGHYLADKKGITLVDVGASDGSFAERVRRHCGLSNALFVEPQPLRCEELRKKFFDLEATIVCAAAADRKGTVEMDILNYDYSSSILKVRRDRTEVNAKLDLAVREVISCRIDTLDGICDEQLFHGAVDLLKIDVQGAEDLVLTGASQLLKRTAAIWTEVSFQPLYDNSATFEDIITICRANGFILKHLEEAWRGANGELLQADALFLKP